MNSIDAIDGGTVKGEGSCLLPTGDIMDGGHAQDGSWLQDAGHFWPKNGQCDIVDAGR